jgi:RNA polymerase-binding transcription factor DksA
MHTDRLALVCPKCSWSKVCDTPEMLKRLRQVKMLIRESDPSPDLVRELFQAASNRMTCQECAAHGLLAREPTPTDLATSTDDDWDDVEWGAAVSCAECGQLIPPERLAVFPETTLCRNCQQARERHGNDQGDVDYCPRCGAVMSLVSGSTGEGLTKYRSKCAECGFRG